jgi:hypothetical protein
MSEHTDQDDGLRPLSPEERIFVRHLRPLLDDPEQVERLKRLLQQEPNILQVSESFGHLSWGGKAVFRVVVGLTGLIIGVAAAGQALKSWAGVK